MLAFLICRCSADYDFLVKTSVEELVPRGELISRSIVSVFPSSDSVQVSLFEIETSPAGVLIVLDRERFNLPPSSFAVSLTGTDPIGPSCWIVVSLPSSV